MALRSRTRKSITNASVAFVIFAIQFLLGLISRKVFVDYLGTEILGLNTTAVNILQFLNLAELGISTAVTFSLYKPLHNNDHTAVNEIVTLQGKIYARIACIIIGGAIVVMFFFPAIFHKMQLPLWYAYASFGVILYAQLLGYFVNYRQIVLTASQMDFKVQLSTGVTHIVKSIAQIFVLSNAAHPYLWWLILEFVFSTTACVVLSATVRRTFPFLKKVNCSFKELRKKYSLVLTKTKQAFIHNIGGFTLSQSSPIIIYAYASLTMVALYGNYLIVFEGVRRMMTSVFGSISAGVGDLVAEGNAKKTISVFFELFSFRFLLSTVVCFSIAMTVQPFITVWLGKQYVLAMTTVTIMALTLFIRLNRNTVTIFLNAFGQYQDVWAPLAEAFINIGLSVLLGYFFGLNGIIGGVLISLVVIVELWKPYFLFHDGFNCSAGVYFTNYIKHILLAVMAGTPIYYGANKYLMSIDSISWANLIIYGIVVSITFSTILTIALYLFIPSFRIFTKRFIK